MTKSTVEPEGTDKPRATADTAVMPPAGQGTDWSRLRVPIAIVAVVLVAVVGVVVWIATSGDPGPAVGNTQVAAPTNSLPAPPPSFPAGDVRGLLLIQPPGTTAVQGLGSEDQTMGLDQFAQGLYSGTAESKNYLQGLGFQVGASVGWASEPPPKYSAQISVVRFAGSGAATWATDSQATIGGNPETESSADLAGIPGAKWFLIKAQSGTADRIMHAVFHRGDVAVNITMWVYGSTNPGILTTVAKQQYEKLPG